ncbi:MAG: glycosyltransferase family 1 protein [Microbacteriaceae bacterium]|nr:glycosyltransferase family 1 protein [Microbacteriaceae bacterium]
MNPIKSAATALRSEGIRSAGWRSAKWFAGRFSPFRTKPLSTVYVEDVVAVDWSIPRDFNGGSIPAREGGYRVAWLITPPGRTSGGHQNAFRFMSFLEEAGHQLTVYLYSPAKYPVVNIEEVKQMLHETSAYPELKAEFIRYDPEVRLVPEFDAIFASDWEATYAAYRYPGQAKRFYFTQDFEPAFFAMGSDYVLAENSYRLGFHGFSAGKWLADKLSREYGMSGDHYDYAVDYAHYRLTNTGPRNEIVFYARPPTPRRATEFGILALLEFHRMRPHVIINMVGWDMSGYDVPFPYVNHSAVDISQLNAIYNRSAAALVLSLTNMSLLPMEVMGSGTVPVVNDGDNTHGFFDSTYIEYVPMSPQAIAKRLVAIVDRPDAVEHAATIAASVESIEWADPGETFITAFQAAMVDPR